MQLSAFMRVLDALPAAPVSLTAIYDRNGTEKNAADTARNLGRIGCELI
jgi:hypothetical protein